MLRRLLVIALTASLLACSDSPEEDRSEPDPDPRTSPSSSPTLEIQPISRIETGVEDAFVFSSRRAVLVAGETSLASIDPETEQLSWRADVPAASVVSAFGSVWAADFSNGVVRRLDPRTGKVQATVPVPGDPIGIGASREGIWTANHREGSLSLIDPRKNKVVDGVEVGPVGPSGPHQIAVIGSRLAVGIPNSNSVGVVDTSTHKVVRSIELHTGMSPCGALLPDGDAVWVSGCLDTDQVVRIDLETGERHGSGLLDVYAGGGILTEDAAWFSAVDSPGVEAAGYLVALDRTSAEELGRLYAGKTGMDSVAAFGSWWVADKDGVARFDPADLVVPD